MLPSTQIVEQAVRLPILHPRLFGSGRRRVARHAHSTNAAAPKDVADVELVERRTQGRWARSLVIQTASGAAASLIVASAAFAEEIVVPLVYAAVDAPYVSYSGFRNAVEKGDVAETYFFGPRSVGFRLRSAVAMPSVTQPPMGYEKLMRAIKGGSLQAPPLAGDADAPPPQAGRTVFRVSLPSSDPSLVDDLRRSGARIEASAGDDQNFLDTVENVIRLVLLVVLAGFLTTQDGGLGTLLKRPATLYNAGGETMDVKFEDVAGCDEAKEELQEVVEALKNPARFAALGARVPRGVLLVGPPGTGKTLLAKAAAGEAGVPFFAASASEFVELFVGLGGRRVRALFAEARKRAPSVIFLDELDAVGRQRSGASGTGSAAGGVANEEREQTLNQLLTEMDGFLTDTGAPVIVLAATNRPEALDSALKRPGRFDRTVTVGLPDLKGRCGILKVHLKGVTVESGLEVEDVAAATTGMTGADLANVVNEAALLAGRRGAAAVAFEDLSAAAERVVAGVQRPSLVIRASEKRIVAFHECGHAILGAAAPAGSSVKKISIVPRGGGALGFTLRAPEGDRYLLSEDEARSTLAMLLGGRGAERLVVGRVTSGAADDLRRATVLAEQMVTDYGMCPSIGPRAVSDGFGGGLQSDPRSPSPALMIAVDEGVDALLRGAEAAAEACLVANRALLEEMAEELIRVETLDGGPLDGFLARVERPAQLLEYVATGVQQPRAAAPEMNNGGAAGPIVGATAQALIKNLI